MNQSKVQAIFDEAVEKYVNAEKNYIRMQGGIDYQQELKNTDETAAALRSRFAEALAEE